MGKLLDDLNRLSATAAQGNILNKGKLSARAYAEGPLHGPVTKAKLIIRHPTCDFVSKYYEVVRELGRGSFSHVKLVRDRRTGHERVCKVVSTEHMTPQVLELTRTEIQVLSALDHPSIVRLYEYSDDIVNKKLVLVLEYISGGDCSGLLEASDKTLSEGRVARLVQQLLVAVSYCHARGVVHRDVKPQNMMLTRSVGAWGSPNLKLIDFGLATQTCKSRDFVGTPAYMSPEVLAGKVDHSLKADMWSMACTAIELLAGEPPFGKPEDFDGDMEPVFESIRRFSDFGDIEAALDELPSWSGRSSQAKDFVRWILRADPDMRPTAEEALSHPWIEANQPKSVGLSADMLRSMSEYAVAPEMLRCCMRVLAARTSISEDPRVGATFTDLAEVDTGFISQEELLDAFASMTTCGWGQMGVDASKIFAAVDLQGAGKIGYTEFASACLYGRCGKSLDKLADQAFHALDADRDGWVCLEDVRRCLGSGAMAVPIGLPGDRPFSPYEWRSAMRTVLAQAAASSLQRKHGKRSVAKAAEETSHPLFAFFNAFMCEQMLCNSCEQCQDADDEKNAQNGDSPVVFRHSFDPNTEMPVPGYELADIVQKPYHVQVV
mmetsp:Transcript_58182/g.149786  ORF Transcript_58182/g.149786 Transcript_58182/m.149786 type:complete len:606 (-) Transcript_58182:138-1955(-)